MGENTGETSALTTSLPDTTDSGAIERDGMEWSRMSLDVAYEYQCWILIGVSCICALLFLLPCLCGTFRNRIAKRFTIWVYSRLHMYYVFIIYLNLFFVCFVISMLPDWNINQYLLASLDFVDWVLIHTSKLIVSVTILLGLYILIRFKERIATAAGVEHMTFFRFGRLNPFHRALHHPIELHIWKALDLPAGPLLKQNDVFIECHLGQNEPAKTRVHNNAGSGCVFKESFQLNVDENDPTEMFTILVRDQELLTCTTLCKLQIKSADLLQIEQQTGAASADFT